MSERTATDLVQMATELVPQARNRPEGRARGTARGLVVSVTIDEHVSDWVMVVCEGSRGKFDRDEVAQQLHDAGWAMMTEVAFDFRQRNKSLAFLMQELH